MDITYIEGKNILNYLCILTCPKLKLAVVIISEYKLSTECVFLKRHKSILCPLYADIAAKSEEILSFEEFPL